MQHRKGVGSCPETLQLSTRMRRNAAAVDEAKKEFAIIVPVPEDENDNDQKEFILYWAVGRDGYDRSAGLT